MYVGLSVVFDGKRDDYFPELIKWATENGASTEGFEIANFEEEGFGLKATREIKVSMWTLHLISKLYLKHSCWALKHSSFLPYFDCWWNCCSEKLNCVYLRSKIVNKIEYYFDCWVVLWTYWSLSLFAHNVCLIARALLPY